MKRMRKTSQHRHKSRKAICMARKSWAMATQTAVQMTRRFTPTARATRAEVERQVLAETSKISKDPRCAVRSVVWRSETSGQR